HGGAPHESPAVVTAPLIALATPSILIGAFTVGPVLFGGYFGPSIFVLSANNVVGRLATQFGGPVQFALHGLAAPPFWLALAGAVTAWACFLWRPVWAGAARIARDTGAVGAAVALVRHRERGAAVPGEAAVDSALRRLVRARRGRHLAAADRAHRVHDGTGSDRRLEGDRDAPGAVLRRLPHHGRPDDRGVLRQRRAAVLFLLGGDADSDVPHHRHLGRAAARLR